MNNYTNPYSRLQTYYGWLSSSSDNLLGMSILELHWKIILVLIWKPYRISRTPMMKIRTRLMILRIQTAIP